MEIATKKKKIIILNFKKKKTRREPVRAALVQMCLPHFCAFFCFLFPRKSSHVIHSFDFQGQKKKQPGKKKQLFHSFKKYPPKVRKNDLIRGKKYGTMGLPFNIKSKNQKQKTQKPKRKDKR